jgi:hypothetical protein
MDQTQYQEICDILKEVVRKLEYIERQVESHRYRTIQGLNGERQIKLEQYRRAYERQHGVVENNPHYGEDELD